MPLAIGVMPKDYIRAMWLMLQQDLPNDYVIATGTSYTVRQFVEACAPYFGMQIEWKGEGTDEHGVDTISNRKVIAVDATYFRPTEIDSLLGDAAKAKRELGWEPEYDFTTLVKDMCEHEIGF